MAILRGSWAALKLFATLSLGSTMAAAQSADGVSPVSDVMVVPVGAQFQAGGVHRLLLGSHYRDLWTTPISVPVLDLATFAGGLEPLKVGGGMQTKSLRFRGADGREYVFRSLIKDPTQRLPAELRPTIAGRISRDQVSAIHPAGPLVAAVLLEGRRCAPFEACVGGLAAGPVAGRVRAGVPGRCRVCGGAAYQ